MVELSLLRRSAAELLDAGITLRESADFIRRELITEALSRSNRNQCAAARALRVHRNTLSREIERLKLRSVVYPLKKRGRPQAVQGVQLRKAG